VVTTVVLGVGVVTVMASILTGREFLTSNGFTAEAGYRTLALGDGPTLRAYGGTVLYLGLVALLSVGIAFVVRHTGGTVTILLVLLYVAPIASLAVTDPRWREWIEKASPMTAGLSIQATRLDTLSISPWSGLGVLGLYAAAAVAAAGATLFRLRDA
jgi:ABC-2 type transport system permease protein